MPLHSIIGGRVGRYDLIDEMKTLPVLIFGGTFDPPHRAHAALPFLVAAEIGCCHVVFIPAAHNPLKEAPPAAPHHRLAMLRTMLADRIASGDASIDECELRRPGPSYTVDTLEELRPRLGARSRTDMRLLLGSDAAISFARWRAPGRILELADPVVVLRPPLDRDGFRELLVDRDDLVRDPDWWLERVCCVPRMDVSANGIRARLAAGQPVGDMLDPGVEWYVRKHRLYGS